jgi:hypothetical protein
MLGNPRVFLHRGSGRDPRYTHFPESVLIHFHCILYAKRVIQQASYIILVSCAARDSEGMSAMSHIRSAHRMVRRGIVVFSIRHTLRAKQTSYLLRYDHITNYQVNFLHFFKSILQNANAVPKNIETTYNFIPVLSRSHPCSFLIYPNTRDQQKPPSQETKQSLRIATRSTHDQSALYPRLQ